MFLTGYDNVVDHQPYLVCLYFQLRSTIRKNRKYNNLIFHQKICEESVLSVEERSNTKYFSNICHDWGVGNSSWLI